MADLTELQSSQAVKIVGASASAGAETYFAAVTSDGELKTAETHNISYVSAVITVTSSQVLAAAGVSNLASRRELLIFNDGNRDIYFGPTGVSATGANKGIKIGVGAFQSIPVGANVNVYLITQTGSTSVIVQEFA